MAKARSKSVTKAKGQSPDFMPANKSWGNPVGKDPNPNPPGAAEEVPSSGKPDFFPVVSERGYSISGGNPTVKCQGEAVDQGKLSATIKKAHTKDSGF
jgi:hypothetical protein